MRRTQILQVLWLDQVDVRQHVLQLLFVLSAGVVERKQSSGEAFSLRRALPDAGGFACVVKDTL